MTSHASTDLLSAYLDGELSADASQRLEDHVAHCPSCRADLVSLRRVIDRLRHVERSAPPPVLAQHVQRRVALEGRPQGLVDRLENRLQRFGGDSSILSLFGVIIALLLFIFLFSVSVDRQRSRSGPVIVPVPNSDWQEPSSAESNTPATQRSTVKANVPQHSVSGRTFAWAPGDRWIEQAAGDLESLPVDRELFLPEALEALPWLADLPTGWQEVRLRENGEQIVIRPSRPSSR